MAIGNTFVFFTVVEAIRTLEANTTLPSTNDHIEENTGVLPHTCDSKPNPPRWNSSHRGFGNPAGFQPAPVPTRGAVVLCTQTSSCFQNGLVPVGSVWLEVLGSFHRIAWINVLEASRFQMPIVSDRAPTESSSSCYLSWKRNSLGGEEYGES